MLDFFLKKLASGQDGRVGKCCAHFLSQPHKNYNYKTTIIKNHLKSRSLITKDTQKKPHRTGRRGGDGERAGPTSYVVVKNWENISAVEVSQRSEEF